MIEKFKRHSQSEDGLHAQGTFIRRKHVLASALAEAFSLRESQFIISPLIHSLERDGTLPRVSGALQFALFKLCQKPQQPFRQGSCAGRCGNQPSITSFRERKRAGIFYTRIGHGAKKEEKMESTSSKAGNKKVIIGVVVLVAVIALFAVIYAVFREKPVEGSKSITIEVVDNEQQSTNYELKTDAEYLRQAMEEADGLTFSGTESEYGLMVDTVNGLKADYNEDHAYWSFNVNGEYCNYGIDTQPVMDGDTFSIIYTDAQ